MMCSNQHPVSDSAPSESSDVRREAEERWRAVYENSAIGIAVTDVSGGFLSVNPVLQRMLGYTEAELRRLSFLDLIPTEDREATRSRTAELVDGRLTEYHVERRYVRKDGGVLWVNTSVSAVPGSDSMPPMLVKIVEDITERKRGEVELLALRDQLATELLAMTRLHELSTRLLGITELQPLLEEVLRAIIALQNADFGNVQLFNAKTGALDIVAQRGFQREFLDYFATVREEGAACGRAFVRRERVIIEDVETDPGFAPHRRIAANAGFRAVQSTPLFSRSGEPLGMISTHFRRPHRPLLHELRLTDLYARQAAEMIDGKAKEAEQRKLATLVEASFDFIGLASLEGEVFFVNRAGRRMVGFNGAELTRIHILDYVAEEDRERIQRQVLPTVLRDGRWEGEARFRHFATGASIPMLQHIFLMREPASERPLALATISRDMTERKHAEEAMRRAQAELVHVTRVMSMGELTTSIAHEVTQPLTAMVTNGYAALRWLDREVPDVGEARAAVERIIAVGSRAGDVISRVRAFAKKAAPNKATLDINEVIREVLPLAQPEVLARRVWLRMELSQSLPPVTGDRVQLQQVVLNLMMNGIEAMHPVTDRPRDLVVKSRLRDEEILVAIQDSGIGFPPETGGQPFDAFFTTKPEGLGLGLTISRRIIEAHGGRLWTTPNAEHGASVLFTLPTDARAGHG
jgi:PAS domain S-box-containing protein